MAFYRLGGAPEKELVKVKLGGAGTYNLSSYKGYEDFEINKNIFVVTDGSISGSASEGTMEWPSSHGSFTPASASYNKNTGVLSVGSPRYYHYATCSNASGNFLVIDKYPSVSVYLIY